MFVQRFSEGRGADTIKVAAEMKAWAKSQGIKVIHALIDANATPFEACKDAARFSAIVNAMGKDGAAECAQLLEDSGDEATFTRRPGTSGCVARTALAAADAEYVVTTISDGCADPDEELHRIMLGKVLNNRGYVAAADEIRKRFEEAAGGGGGGAD
ncbi:hypothetical protein FE257_002660 [Aspergillus nanangensis]|uniref:Isochorismatase-like domain-containing protein n=1 Tax=Aspergillus nanangensis TaxID=2582783 RepID=A0AAD4GNY5_ASPNN|nr:hypothetical protein FE257_002660 [Aspergillus nanangensis]